MRSLAAIIVTTTLLIIAATSAFGRGDPIVIYNASPSAPVGFYVRDTSPPRTGMFVTVRAATVAPDYARIRAFDDPTDRFIKRVAAGPGAHVCASGDQVSIADTGVITRQTHDGAGRALPAWSECRALRADEFFLLGETSDSFDSRYWGPVTAASMDGVWRPLDPDAMTTDLLRSLGRD